MFQQPRYIKELHYGHKVYDFMRWNYIAFNLSVILLMISIVIIVIRGFNWGLEFTGGTVIELTQDNSFNVDQVRDALVKVGWKNILVQKFGSSRDIVVRIAPGQSSYGKELGNEVLSIINQTTGQNANIKRVDFVGPSVGSDLVIAGSIALLAAFICILIYVSLRFEWRLATGVVLSLVHDVLITLGMLSLSHIEIDSTIIASLMSVISYSLNDSIVVLDRIRDNFRKIQDGNSYDIFNLSLTQVFNRTIITSATTMIVALILFIFGGAMLRSFAVTLLVGMCIGTISSIYIASALALKFGIKHEHLFKQKVETEGIT